MFLLFFSIVAAGVHRLITARRPRLLFLAAEGVRGDGDDRDVSIDAINDYVEFDEPALRAIALNTIWTLVGEFEMTRTFGRRLPLVCLIQFAGLSQFFLQVTDGRMMPRAGNDAPTRLRLATPLFSGACVWRATTSHAAPGADNPYATTYRPVVHHSKVRC